jgi:hypothetical protein
MAQKRNLGGVVTSKKSPQKNSNLTERMPIDAKEKN